MESLIVAMKRRMAEHGLTGALDVWRAWLLRHADDAALMTLWDAPDRREKIRSFAGYARKQIYALYELLSAGSSRGELIQVGRGLYAFPDQGDAMADYTPLSTRLAEIVARMEAHGLRGSLDLCRVWLVYYADQETLIRLWDAPDRRMQMRKLEVFRASQIDRVRRIVSWLVKKGGLIRLKRGQYALRCKSGIYDVEERVFTRLESHGLDCVLDIWRVWLLCYADDRTLLELWDAPDRRKQIRHLPNFHILQYYAISRMLRQQVSQGKLVRARQGVYVLPGAQQVVENYIASC